MDSPKLTELRVLAANETVEDLEQIASLVIQIGHVVVARGVRIDQMARVAAEERPDVAVVGLRGDTAHALDLISEITRAGICPVITLIAEENPEFTKQASERGIYAYASPIGPEELRGAIDVALSRFGRYEQLEGAMSRRGTIERAKGILMERYLIGEQQAFEMLRRQARSSGMKIGDAAETVVHAHRLLPPQSPAARQKPTGQ